MSVFVRGGSIVRSISTIVLTATLPASALADSSAGELVGAWGQVLHFPPALKGELTVKRGGKNWSASIAGAQAPCSVEDQRIACAFSDGRGTYRGRLNGTGRAIEGWWLRPSGETTDRRDPGGSGGSFAISLASNRPVPIPGAATSSPCPIVSVSTRTFFAMPVRSKMWRAARSWPSFVIPS